MKCPKIVEPALAKWKFGPAIELWRQRLNDQNIRRTHLLLAIDGLGTVEDRESVKRLLEIVSDPNEKRSIRLAAARSGGMIGGDHLVEFCKVLAKSTGPDSTFDRLCCIELLQKHDSEDAVSLLQKLMVDESGAVAGAAWQRVIEIDSKLALSFIEQCIDNEDPVVLEGHRYQPVMNIPTSNKSTAWGILLADRHPEVRTAARDSLRRLAGTNEQFDRQIREIGSKAIAEKSAQYRGVEQGLLLLTELQHQSAAEQIVRLLRAQSSESLCDCRLEFASTAGKKHI